MMTAIGRNAAVIGGVILCGLIIALAAEALRSPRGTLGPTLFLAQSPVKAFLAVAGCLGLGAMLAGVVGRVSNTAVGMFVLGCGLFALASRLSSVRDLALGFGGHRGTLALLAVESLIWAALALAATWVVFRVSGPLRDVEPDAAGRSPHVFRSAEAWRSAAAGVLMVPVMWLMAQSPMKGQMLGGAIAGGVLVGLVGRLVSPHVQPLLLFASAIAAGAVGYVIAAAGLQGSLDASYVHNTMPSLALPMPADYAGGAVIGVSWGLGWAKSFLHHEESASSGEAAAQT